MQKPDYHTIRDTLKALCMLAVLIGGGMGIGFGIAIERTRDLLVDERRDRLAEIERLQEAYGRRLGSLGADVRTAATAAADAAGTAAAASETAQAAAATAGKAAKAAGVVPAAIEQDRKAINNAIGKANARIGEGAR